MAIRYAVDSARDDEGALLRKVTEIAKEGGRVISVTWQPERNVTIEGAGIMRSSGYTVVSEYGP